MVSTPCPRPAPSPASRTMSTSQRRSRPAPPHLNARQHIPDPSTHPDRGPAYLSRARCRPISSRSLNPDTRRPSATLWQPPTKKGNGLTPYFLSWSPPSVTGPDSAATTWETRSNRSARTTWRKVGREVSVPTTGPAGRYVPVVAPHERAPLPRKPSYPLLPLALLRSRRLSLAHLYLPGSSTLRREEARGAPELMGARGGAPSPSWAQGGAAPPRW